MMKKYFHILHNRRGQALLATYMVIMIILGLGAALTVSVIQNKNLTEIQRESTIAFNIAEGGVERAVYFLKEDFEALKTTGCWNDGDIYGQTFPAPMEEADADGFFLIFDNVAYGSGIYTVRMKIDGDEGMWIRSEGTYLKNDGTLGGTRSLEAYAYLSISSIWDNAIFAGAGASGKMINGNVDIAGNVHILGNGLTSADYAVDIGGTAQLIGNNYDFVSADMKARLPDPSMDIELVPSV